MKNPFHCYSTEIAFADTDASGWMHFPNIFRYVEAAEHECLRQRGVVVYDRDKGGWPRVKVSSDFKKPMLTGDAIEIHLAISAIGNSSLTWQFEVLLGGAELAAHGSMTTVRVDQTGKPQLITPAEREALTAN